MRIKKLGFLMFTFVVAMMFIQVVYADNSTRIVFVAKQIVIMGNSIVS